MAANSDKFVRPNNSRLYVGQDGDYITTYNRLDQNHKNGFVANLVEQARSHGHGDEVGKQHACVVSNMIGREFDVILLCGPNGAKADYVKGMVVLNHADTAEGKKMLVEDIVVDGNMRQKGYATTLMRYCAIEAWDAGMGGLTLEVGRDNIPGQKLYEKLGATITTNYQKPEWGQFHDVWHVSAERVCAIATSVYDGDQTAELATPENLESMVRVLADQPNRDSGSLSRILARQQNVILSRHVEASRDTMSNKDRSFVVALPDGSFAITTEAYSTFMGGMRSDARLYLAAKGDRQKVAKLIKGVCAESVRRAGWGGSINIEFCDNVKSITPEKLAVETDKIRTAEAALSSLGGVPLEHNGARMVPFEISGDAYLSAVTEAVSNFPERPLTNGALKRFHDLTSKRNNLGLVA